MTCRCDSLDARLAVIEQRLGISPQASLFVTTPPDPGLAPATPKYPRAFEEVWERTGRVGTKYKALLAWERVKRPPWSAIAPGWTAYMRSARPVEGFVQDLSTWLGNRGWAQAWPPANVKRPPPPAPAFSGPTYKPPTGACFAHAEDPKCRTKVNTPGCPECSEQREDETLEPAAWMAMAESLP